MAKNKDSKEPRDRKGKPKPKISTGYQSPQQGSQSGTLDSHPMRKRAQNLIDALSRGEITEQQFSHRMRNMGMDPAAAKAHIKPGGGRGPKKLTPNQEARKKRAMESGGQAAVDELPMTDPEIAETEDRAETAGKVETPEPAATTPEAGAAETTATPATPPTPKRTENPGIGIMSDPNRNVPGTKGFPNPVPGQWPGMTAPGTKRADGAIMTSEGWVLPNGQLENGGYGGHGWNQGSGQGPIGKNQIDPRTGLPGVPREPNIPGMSPIGQPPMAGPLDGGFHTMPINPEPGGGVIAQLPPGGFQQEVPQGGIVNNWKPSDPAWVAEMEKQFGQGFIGKIQEQMNQAIKGLPQGTGQRRAAIYNVLQQSGIMKANPNQGPIPGGPPKDPYQSPPFNPGNQPTRLPTPGFPQQPGGSPPFNPGGVNPRGPMMDTNPRGPFGGTQSPPFNPGGGPAGGGGGLNKPIGGGMVNISGAPSPQPQNARNGTITTGEQRRPGMADIISAF